MKVFVRPLLIPALVAGVLGLSPAVLAQLDVTPPQIVGMGIAPSAVDVTYGPGVVAVDLHILDNFSGFQDGTWLAAGPGGVGLSGVFYTPALIGNANDGTYEPKIVVPPQTGAGTWTVTQIVVHDSAGNGRIYGTSELTTLGFPVNFDVSFTVVDATAPRIEALSFAPAAVDVTGAPVDVAVSVRITDDLLGFAGGTILFASPSGKRTASGTIALPPSSGDPFDGTYDVVVTIPRFAEPGIWKVKTVSMTDSRNPSVADTAALVNSGFPVDLAVTDATPDFASPALSGFSILPAAIDPSIGQDTTTFTWTATDDASGVDHGSLLLAKQEFPYTNFTVPFSGPPVVGTPQNGTFQAVFQLPSGSGDGIWSVSSTTLVDLIGNTTTLDSNGLLKLGIQAELTVFSGPDLRTGNLAAVPPPLPGKTYPVQVSGSVLNTGTRASAGTNATIWADLNSNTKLDAAEPRVKVNVPPIAAGGSAPVSGMLDVQRLGTLPLHISADSALRIVEASEVNNDNFINLGLPGPDLVIYNPRVLSIQPSDLCAPGPGCNLYDVTIELVAWNWGALRAPNVVVKYDTYASVTLPSLNSGQSRTLQQTIKGLKTKFYVLLLAIDPGQSIPETNEGNNTVKLSFQVGNPGP